MRETGIAAREGGPELAVYRQLPLAGCFRQPRGAGRFFTIAAIRGVEKYREIYYVWCMMKRKGKVVIPPDIYPWPHELRVARILAMEGHLVEFMPAAQIKSADILLDGVEYEIKSPITNKPDNRQQPQIGKLIFITKNGQVIDIKASI